MEHLRLTICLHFASSTLSQSCSLRLRAHAELAECSRKQQPHVEGKHHLHYVAAWRVTPAAHNLNFRHALIWLLRRTIARAGA